MIEFLAIDPTVATEELSEYAESLFPREMGIEVECDSKTSFRESDFRAIEGVIDCECDPHEKRFRVCSGLVGLKAIYKICELLQKQCILTESGIHCHIDARDFFVKLTKEWKDNNKEWILMS